MTNLKDEVEALRHEVDRLNAKIAKTETPSYPTDAEVARAKDQAHQMAERRASAFSAFTRDQLRAMNEACPDPQSIVHDQRGAPIGPTSIIPRRNQPASNVQRETINTSGYAHNVPLKNGLGQGR